MMSGFAFGFFLAAVVYGLIGAFGWRWVFAIGVLPALLVVLVRRGIRESEPFIQTRARRAALKRRAVGELTAAELRFRRFVLVQLVTPPLRRHLLLTIGMSIGGLVAFWAVTIWLP